VKKVEGLDEATIDWDGSIISRDLGVVLSSPHCNEFKWELSLE
jgi:hypothetical protein